MRVISGIYKRRRFDVPRTFKARPTTDVKNVGADCITLPLNNVYKSCAETEFEFDLEE